MNRQIMLSNFAKNLKNFPKFQGISENVKVFDLCRTPLLHQLASGADDPVMVTLWLSSWYDFPQAVRQLTANSLQNVFRCL
ncbi:MAG: hypothetical protein GDA43_13800 [Hormoscilla sp. SP5CHS1]|nr:hypothetical protein [Hormoscilla sp. SP5CHS1]